MIAIGIQIRIKLLENIGNRKGSRKKSYFFVVRPLRGGGVKAGPLRRKDFFCLVVGPQKNLFLRLSLLNTEFEEKICLQRMVKSCKNDDLHK